MTDKETQRRVTVGGAEEGPYYISVPVEQMKAVEDLLTRAQLRYWLDEFTVAIQGGPAVMSINLPQGTPTKQVQSLLDAVD